MIVGANNPWNELSPYQEGQSIYGRNQIISRISEAIHTNLQTILYGKSGIGKTSLLQAGCFPELRKRNMFPIIIRPGIMESSDDYIATIIDIIVAEAKKEINEIKPPLNVITISDAIFTENRLCQFFFGTKFVDNDNVPYLPVLIFDQFEELLNNKGLQARSVDLLTELYVLLDNTISVPPGFLEYSNYRFVFALREDYLYCIEDIIDRYNFDELRYNRHRITALSDRQARIVVEKTFKGSAPTILQEDLTKITEIIISKSKGTSTQDDIRTPILSLLGFLLYKQWIDNQDISANNAENELYLYYDEIMSSSAIPIEVRSFIETKLITLDGRRDSMDYQSALLTGIINQEQIDYLTKSKRILNLVDLGAGEKRLEFAHDTICKTLTPVIEMREAYYKKGNELYYKSFDKEDAQPEMVRYLSYASDLGHLQAYQKLVNLYEENVKGIAQDKKYKSEHNRRYRLSILLNGGEWYQVTAKEQSDRRYDVFISYASKDRDSAILISSELMSMGCMVFRDENSIESGEVFAHVIIEAIKSSKIFVVLVSANSSSSQWVARELAYAAQLEKRIIPVIIDDYQVELMSNRFMFILGRLNMVDFRNKRQKEKLYQDILRMINSDKRDYGEGGIESLTVMLDDYAINLSRVDGGLFAMGATHDQGGENFDESPVHNVRLDSYYISQNLVTQELWKRVMGKQIKLNLNATFNTKYNYPIVNVSWNDAVKFIKRLNLLTGKEFRLPSEAEWEFAAKGGAKGRLNGYKFSGSNNCNAVSWNYENSAGKMHEVAQKQPNELGLYDMSGNVWEWCEDWYAPYSIASVENPKGPKSGDRKVCRGGSFANTGRDCRISIRGHEAPNEGGDDIGFRLVLQ